ncbi:sodium/hydrogen exchanger [Gordonia bronchialis DSM 43247]|uniref:Sodium/hydrogen exchanger n=1 Tax=Gordonia bronchialis (strain ATCC 25592 / DSM 43247 / BCRC 13721 / JCM 3198 / KCTC 3076 / NBRC 16047 / NCTC 10667) TaxID=526226 RepID=D0L6W7_GORB4|nr:cation:proton antiporter [Gordonia bronchialis]ACY20752.1 sodium/hydrogen exchanger [Gordonia bronchialis DSM 43247]MCC3323526.1 cation:proton antiporter [Gordonia bronchialis]QGS25500.1 cation/H(+) antiporter [Gordonia bronchialis]STQ63585.1 glutathione-regulated potassium-efflux system protein KefB [Gordonia bronchialis]
MDKHWIFFLLLDVGVIIAAARIGGAIARKFRQPAVVGEIAAGIALGPSLLGLIPGGIDTWLFPSDVRPLLGALAQIGLVLFMFIVGLELDMRLIRGRERASASISLSSIAVPFALGAALAVVLYPKHDVVDGKTIEFLAFALFLGIAMSITAFPVLARILTDRGMMRTPPGVFSLASAAIDDIVAWTLLAFVIAVISGGSPLEVARIVGLSLVYAAIMFLVVRPLLAKLITWRDSAGRMTPDLLAVILIGLFLSAAVTDIIGIHQIFGAFLFGAMMPKVGAEQLHREILERLEQVSVLLLLPMFFVVTGFSVDLAGIGLGGLWQLGLVLIVAVAGKFVGAYFGARVSAIPKRQSAAIAVLMNTRGLTELVILNAGLTLGVLTTELFSMMVVMALVTTVLTEPLLRLVYPDSVVANDIAAAERRLLGVGTTSRVMIVLPNLDGTPEELVARHRRLLGVGAGHDVVLVALLPTAPPGTVLEVGIPVIPDFAAMASAVEELNAVGSSLVGPTSVSVLCRFSADPVADLTQMAENANPDFIFLDAADIEVATRLSIAPVALVNETASADDEDTAVVCSVDDSRSGRTAILVAASLAVADVRRLVIETSMSRRRLAADLQAVRDRGVEVDIVANVKGALGQRLPLVVSASGTDPAVGIPARPLVVVDNSGTSEEALGDRADRLFLPRSSADSTPSAASSTTASSPEGH